MMRILKLMLDFVKLCMLGYALSVAISYLYIIAYQNINPDVVMRYVVANSMPFVTILFLGICGFFKNRENKNNNGPTINVP